MTEMSVTKRVALPVIYEEAVRDLIACQTLDEAKYFANKADALAAFAKMYHLDEAGIEAKRLKLHAYRRMGEIAEELAPLHQAVAFRDKPLVRTDGRVIPAGTALSRRSIPGSRKLLIAQGLSLSEASLARRVARTDKFMFDKLVNSPRPPSVHQFNYGFSPGSRSKNFRAVRQTLSVFLSACRRLDAAKTARDMTEDEARLLRQNVTSAIEWLDQFERFLPKGVAP